MKGGILAVAAGLAAGLVAERVAVHRPWVRDSERDERFARVRGVPGWVVADDGTRIYTETHEDGDPSLPTLVLSHGFCLNQHSWHYQRRDLRGRVRIVAWDQRAHGRSLRGPRSNSTIEQLGRDLAAVLQQTTEGPVVLAGHSMGGMTVMSFARQFPELLAERIQGVGLVATAAGDLPAEFLGVPKAAINVVGNQVGALQVDRLPMLRTLEILRRNDVNYSITRRMSFGPAAPDSLNRFTVDMLNATPIDVVLEFLPTLLEHDEYEGLAALRGLPAFVAVGDLDQMTPPTHTQRILTALPDAHDAILPGSGHMVMLDQHQVVTEGIWDLVRRAKP